MEWMLMPLKRYAEFSGRSRRKEYWMFVLFQFLIYVAFLVLMMLFGGGALMSGRRSDRGCMAGGRRWRDHRRPLRPGSLGLLIPSLAVGGAQAPRYQSERLVDPRSARRLLLSHA